jgi:protein-S-isoprenylcysteine O-methyltransferase Ste14
MIQILFYMLTIIWIGSEAYNSFRLLARNPEQKKDYGTLIMIWVVVIVSVAIAFTSPLFKIPLITGDQAVLTSLGIILIVIGVTIRRYAITTLGKFFTMNVVIQEDHHLCRTGLYQHVRHPAYTGMIIAFFGIGIGVGNWLALFIPVVPVTFVLLHRIRLEERALIETFGEDYMNYKKNVKCLFPFIY